jgi:hypothetical protein
MDSIDYSEFTTDSDAFIELEDFDCFIELESSLVVYADRLSRSKYTLGTTDNFDNNNLLENEILTVPKSFLRLNSFNKKSESFNLISYDKQSEFVYPKNELNKTDYIPKIFASKESLELLNLLSKTEIVLSDTQTKYAKFDLKERYFSSNTPSDTSSFGINVNHNESDNEKIEKVIEKTKQIIVQNNIENKKINYKFDTTKIEQKNSSNVTNNQLVNLMQSQVTRKDLDSLKKDVTSSFHDELKINKEKTLKESEAISKKIVKEEFSKFLR